jgi:hypothetical protein
MTPASVVLQLVVQSGILPFCVRFVSFDFDLRCVWASLWAVVVDNIQGSVQEVVLLYTDLASNRGGAKAPPDGQESRAGGGKQKIGQQEWDI